MSFNDDTEDLILRLLPNIITKRKGLSAVVVNMLRIAGIEVLPKISEDGRLPFIDLIWEADNKRAVEVFKRMGFTDCEVIPRQFSRNIMGCIVQPIRNKLGAPVNRYIERN